MSTITIYSDYFKSSLLALEGKIASETARSYDYYQMCHHDETQYINNHRINAAYRLRFDAGKANDDGTVSMLDVPTAIITAEIEFREHKDSHDSCGSKKKSFNVVMIPGTLEEQIDYALEVLRSVITENPVPQIPIDFWKLTADSMVKWDKSYEATLKAHQLTLSAKN